MLHDTYFFLQGGEWKWASYVWSSAWAIIIMYNRLYFCAQHFLSKMENGQLFSSSLPHFDKCHEMSRIFTSRVLAVPSFYMNVGHFSEYSGHPNNKFQTLLKNSRVQVGVYLWCTKICIFQSRFCTIFFKIFCSVFPEKFMKNHFHFANLFTGLGFSTCTFLWNRAS